MPETIGETSVSASPWAPGNQMCRPIAAVLAAVERHKDPLRDVAAQVQQQVADGVARRVGPLPHVAFGEQLDAATDARHVFVLHVAPELGADAVRESLGGGSGLVHRRTVVRGRVRRTAAEAGVGLVAWGSLGLRKGRQSASASSRVFASSTFANQPSSWFVSADWMRNRVESWIGPKRWVSN